MMRYARLGGGDRPCRLKGQSMNTVKLTASQALVRYLCAQQVEPGVPYIAGVWAIFGHGNVAGLGGA